MKLTSLLQLVDKLQQAGNIGNLQQVCAVFAVYLMTTGWLKTSYITHWCIKIYRICFILKEVKICFGVGKIFLALYF